MIAAVIIYLVVVGTVIAAVSIAATSDRRQRPQSVMRVERVGKHGVAYICAWCESNGNATAWAEANGLLPSHGICPLHQQQQLSSDK